MRASFGQGGWVAVDDTNLPGPLYVRFREDAGRLRISELYLDASRGQNLIDARDIRGLSIGQIEAAINNMEEYVRYSLEHPAPDLSVLASYFGMTFVHVDEPLGEGNWVAGCFASQLLPPGVKRGATESGHPVMRVPHASRRWKFRETDESFRLTAGPTEGLTDEFLRDVTRAYAAAVLRGERPNVAISEQTGYPLKTAQRWVYTARMRGFMPRGRRGAVG
jgi:hypothetical protein